VHEEADNISQVKYGERWPRKNLTAPSHVYMNKGAGIISNSELIITGTTDFIFDTTYELFIASRSCGPGRRD